MSKISPIFKVNKDAIQEQACLWVSKMDRSLSLEEKNDFIQWVNQSELHREILFDFARLWDDLSVLNELSALFPIEKQKAKRRAKSKLTRIAMAASIALAVLIGNYFHFAIPTHEQSNNQQFTEIKNLKTVVGQQASFSLSDGSIIQLNTNSLVKINFSKDKRLLTLVKGEARFDVAKDKIRPFTVTVGNKSFTALGTIFNVEKKSEQEMELVVTEGKVLITKASEILDNISDAFAKLPRDQLPGILVQSGEKAIIEKDLQAPVQKVSLGQVQKDLAWQQGMLIFEGESLVDALKEVSRYTSTHFEITDPQLANIKVAGYFKAGDIEGLLQSLHSNFNITFEKTHRNSIRLSLAQ